jgi:peptidyl-dipeptidase A
MKFAASVSLAALALAGCAAVPPGPAPVAAIAPAASAAPATASAEGVALTPAGADAFVAQAEKELADLSIYVNRASWVNATYITEDTDALAAQAGAEYTEAQVRLASQAAQFDKVPGLSFDTRRKLDILKQSIVAPAANVPGAADELSTLLTGLQSQYGKGKGTFKGKPTAGNDLEELMGTVRDPALLQEMWVSWHNNVGRPMAQDYTRFVGLANAGAKELGYADVGACSPRRARSAPTSSATCGRRSGAASTTSSRPRVQATSATISQISSSPRSIRPRRS